MKHADPPISGYEACLYKFSSLLHANHHIMVDLEFSLVQMYVKNLSGQETLEERLRQARRKKQLAEHVLQVMDMVRVLA